LTQREAEEFKRAQVEHEEERDETLGGDEDHPDD
jgi:hypothetical protein